MDMVMMISRTYEVVTPESAEQGDFADCGFDFEAEPFTFRELVRLIDRDGFCNCSCSPASGSVNEWLSTNPEPDYHDGSETSYALHFDRTNAPRYAKYWAKAIRYATRKAAQ
jgi:hypothetical protein